MLCHLFLCQLCVGARDRKRAAELLRGFLLIQDSQESPLHVVIQHGWSLERTILITSVYVAWQHHLVVLWIFLPPAPLEGVEMLFTDENWAETSFLGRAVAKPYQPWRCVGWTDDSICFWVLPGRQSNRSGTLPDGLLVVGPEVLLDVVGQMPPDAFSVYVMDANAEEQQPAARILRLTGLWSQPRINTTARSYWYQTEEGDFRSCSRLQEKIPGDSHLQQVLNLVGQRSGGPGMVAA